MRRGGMLTRRHWFKLGAGVVGVAACRSRGNGGTIAAAPRADGDPAVSGEAGLTIVVPWAPGGASDVLMRIAAEHLQGALDEPVAVRNVPGGGGIIGARQVLGARPDGRTVLAAHEWLITAHYTGAASFTWRDFEPIALLFSSPEVVVVRADRGWRSLDSLLAQARHKPDTVRWGATFGSTSHFLAAEVMYRAGVSFRLVGYEGVTERLDALLSGAVDVAASPAASVLDLVRAGQLRPLALAGVERDAALGDVPTLREQGIEVTFTTNRGLLAPRGVPAAELSRLERAAEQALMDAELLQRVQDELHTHVRYLNGAHYTAELERWDATIRLLAEQMGLSAIATRP